MHLPLITKENESKDAYLMLYFKLSRTFRLIICYCKTLFCNSKIMERFVCVEVEENLEEIFLKSGNLQKCRGYSCVLKIYLHTFNYKIY